MKRTTVLLRSLLVLLFVLLLGGLALVDVLRSQGEQSFPHLAHLGWPTFIGICLGFLPVVLALRRMYVLAGLVAGDEAFSSKTVDAIGQIKRYIIWFVSWFAVGIVAFRLAFGFFVPAVGVLWLLLEVAALFLFAVVAILERLFASAVLLREDADLTI